MENLTPIDHQLVQSKIYTIRNTQVMLDRDLAELYGVQTKALNQAVKRNSLRFPERYCFQLNQQEFENLKSQIVTSSGHGGRRTLPYAFTEQGVSMLSTVLKSETAINTSIEYYQFVDAHDRFIIIDNQDIYHLGASLKDLGKKWFAFSKMQKETLRIIEKLEEVRAQRS